MKRNLKRFTSLVMAVCLLAGIAVTARAATHASDYFWVTDVWATRTGGGSFLVEFDIGATDIMKEIGATEIYIYEQQADGDYDNVYTFTSEKKSALIAYNTSAHGYGVTYRGTPGKKYFATLALYCRDADGAEWLYEDTNIITA